MARTWNLEDAMYKTSHASIMIMHVVIKMKRRLRNGETIYNMNEILPTTTTPTPAGSGWEDDVGGRPGRYEGGLDQFFARLFTTPSRSSTLPT
eukprot:scaffold5533_cov111-Skeletonema_dohrnii-CCMP3373.AAC.7